MLSNLYIQIIAYTFITNAINPINIANNSVVERIDDNVALSIPPGPPIEPGIGDIDFNVFDKDFVFGDLEVFGDFGDFLFLGGIYMYFSISILLINEYFYYILAFIYIYKCL
jgi:hypothetical protein